MTLGTAIRGIAGRNSFHIMSKTPNRCNTSNRQGWVDPVMAGGRWPRRGIGAGQSVAGGRKVEQIDRSGGDRPEDPGEQVGRKFQNRKWKDRKVLFGCRLRLFFIFDF
jgi:hypothetical protein